MAGGTRVLPHNIDAEQSQLTGPPNEFACQRPVLRLETVEHRQHLLIDEVGHGLRDHPLFVGHALR